MFARDFMMPVVIHLPVKMETINQDGDLIIRASVTVPADSWKRPHWPTDAQIEAMLLNAFKAMRLPGQETVPTEEGGGAVRCPVKV